MSEGKDISLDEITKRVVDAILEERHIDKVNLPKLIRPILKVWLKKTDSFKKTKSANKNQLQRTIESRGLKEAYWHAEMKKLTNPQIMYQHYKNIDELLTKEGFKK